MLKGYRTYLSIIAMVVVTTIGTVIETGGTVILSPEITAAVVVLLGAVAAYFRRAA